MSYDQYLKLELDMSKPSPNKAQPVFSELRPRFRFAEFTKQMSMFDLFYNFSVHD